MAKKKEPKPRCYIFDIDHTISKPVNRGPYGKFQEDEIIPALKFILECIAYRNSDKYRLYMQSRIHIIIVSGRKEHDHKFETVKWLTDHQIIYEELHLNPTDPCTPAKVFKLEKFKELKEKYDILGVFDDDIDVAGICAHLDIPSFHFTHNS